MASLSERLPILDVWVDPVTMQQAIGYVRETLKTGQRPHSIFAVNPEKNFSVPRDPVLYETFKSADLLIPDGVGVVLAARLLHGAHVSRVPGVELMENICKLAAAEGHSIFIYGSKPDVNLKSAEMLKRRYPDLRIAGLSDGYVKESEMDGLVRKINESRAEILFLALGSPKQERWYAACCGRLEHVKICQGIGGTLDTIAGNVKRAPEIWCKFSAEWLYRLLAEPKRIRRQKVLPLFAMKVLLLKGFGGDRGRKA
jgi:N-acetylglucosaminyldiphosphoundecaprenol N-acetyl-beta-D-mannosaminyltransferase